MAQFDQNAPVSEFEERVVGINRCSKVVKGGRRFSFSALVVVGNKNGKVGYGTGKAKEVSEAIRKGTEAAHKNMQEVNLRVGTIPHAVQIKQGAKSQKVARTNKCLVCFRGKRLVWESAKNVLQNN